MATSLKVVLSHAKNPDIDGGYWSQTTDSGRAVKCSVLSLTEASQVCRRYIDRNNLGGGNWTGGRVLDEHGAVVARVSYNGRVWDKNGLEVVA